MPISTFSNPIPEILSGFMQGHELGLRIKQAKQADQEFKTRQALQEQNMSIQDIMNRKLLQENARPVSGAGTVMSPAGPDLPSDVQGMPASPGAPAYTRKADPSRTVKYGGGQYELLTPEEQQQRTLSQQTSGMDVLQAAKDRAAANSIKSQHDSQLKLEGGGTPAQGLSMMGIPDGTMLTRDELFHHKQEMQKYLLQQQALQKGRQLIVRPGETVYDTSPAGQQPGQQPGAPAGPTMEPIAMPPAAAGPTQIPGLPAPAPPLANNPTVARMRIIASGGPANPTGEGARFATWAPGYYQRKGITNPRPEDVSAAYEQFLKLKPEDAETEIALAQRAVRGDKDADAALKRLDASRLASRPVNNFNVTMPGLGPGTASAANPAAMGEDFMKTLPAGTAAQVRAIAEGRAAMPSASARTPAAMALRDAVFRLDPSYTDQRAQVRKAFTTGKDGTNIGNLNTATVHLDQMAEAAKAMQNGTWQPGNQLYNYIATKFGAAAPTNYTAVMNAFSGEAANALKGSATDTEIAHVMSTLGQNMSPQQAAGVANTNLHILGSKLNTYHERYQQQIPGDTVYSPVLPSARAVFQKYGMTETGGQPRGVVGPIANLPRGGGRSADAATIKQFLDAAGGDKNAARQSLTENGWTIPPAR